MLTVFTYIIFLKIKAIISDHKIINEFQMKKNFIHDVKIQNELLSWSELGISRVQADTGLLLTEAGPRKRWSVLM